MSRVLLIGAGPLPSPELRELGFPQLRTSHFLEGLRRAGHAVRALLLVRGARARRAGPGWEGDHAVDPEAHDALERAAELAEGAEVVVSAGPYGPGGIAASLVEDRPWFADVPGDPLAELQALAIAGAPHLRPRATAALAEAHRVLGRADALGAVSEAQRHALVGHLGLLGRLVDADPAERVFVLPVAWRFPEAPRPARPRAAGDPLRVALVGGFNTWFDDQTAAAGLDGALRAEPGLSVVALGGAITGHYQDGFRRFQAWAEAWPDRVQIVPWVESSALPRWLDGAHVGLCLDRPGYEAELGSRTRLLYFAHQGLLTVGTARAELARHMEALGAMRSVPVGDPQALSAALREAVARPAPVEGLAEGVAQLSERYAPDRALAPLLAWMEAPRRRVAALSAEQSLSEALARTRAELRAVQQSPTWKAMAAGHRLVRKVRG